MRPFVDNDGESLYFVQPQFGNSRLKLVDVNMIDRPANSSAMQMS